MKNYFKYHAKFLLALVLGITLFSCNNDDENDNDGNLSTVVTLDEAVTALGLKNSLETTHTVQYSATGKMFEYEQAITGLENPLTSNEFSYSLKSRPLSDELFVDYDFIEFNHPVYYKTDGPYMIINGNEGTVAEDFIWKSYYLGVRDPHAMFSSEIYANLKNQLMANPIALVRSIYKNLKGDGSTILTESNAVIETLVEELNITVEFDPSTSLPIRSYIQEADFINGDSRFQVLYEQWKEFNGFQFPTSIKYYLNNDLLKEESLTDVVVNAPLDDEVFKVQEVSQPLSYDQQSAEFGIYHSQFYHRWNAWNIGWPEPVNNGAMALGDHDLTQFQIAPQFINDKIKIIGRPDNRLWSLAIDTEDGIIMIDAPLNQKWTRSIIDAAKRTFSKETIKAGIITHSHHDHFAGVRELASEVDILYFAEEGYDEMEEALNSIHTIYPDTYASTNDKPAYEIVENITYLENGSIEIHKLAPTNTVATPHADDMVVVYFPNEKVLWQSDQQWNGTFTHVWNGQTAKGFTDKAKLEIANNATYLLDYINEKGLDVDKIVAAHGGLESVQSLEQMASYKP